jgi:hypothetical protein
MGFAMTFLRDGTWAPFRSRCVRHRHASLRHESAGLPGQAQTRMCSIERNGERAGDLRHRDFIQRMHHEHRAAIQIEASVVQDK